MGIEKQIKKTRSMVSVSTYKRPKLFVILTMVLINLVILAIAAIIAMMINPDIHAFIPAMGHSIKWLLTPNAILDIEHTETLVLATIVFVIGLILFSGTIIALTTNAIKEYFQKKETNAGKIYLEDHIVILNYNSKVPELVSDLLYIGEKDLNLLILSELDKSYIERHLLNELRKSKKFIQSLAHVRLLVKQGNPLLKSELEDISIDHAKAVLIMNKDMKSDGDTLHSDMNVIKVILSLAEFQFLNKTTIVSEVKHYESKQRIESLKSLVRGLDDVSVLPICFDRRLGQIMAQTIIDNKMDDIYLSLFSFQGAEVYLLKNHTFEDCLIHHSHLIPLEEKGDDVYVLAEHDLDIYKRSSHPFEPKLIKSKRWTEGKYTPIHIVGNNNKLQFLIQSFHAYEKLYEQVYPLTVWDEKDIHQMIESLNSNDEEGTILLLSNEIAMEDAIDTNVLSTLIDIQSQLKNSNVHVIVELLEPKNSRLIQDFKIEKTIISNKIISLLLSKLALLPETADFYDQLLSISPSQDGKDDYAMTVKRADESFDETFPLRFSSKKQLIHSSYISKNKEAIMIGFFRNDHLTLFSGNLHEEEPLLIFDDDLLVWMKR